MNCNQLLRLSTLTIVVGLCLCRYQPSDAEDYEEQYLAQKEDATRLLGSLQRADNRFRKYYDLLFKLPRSRFSSKDSLFDDNSNFQDKIDDILDSELSPAEQKRQASSGAQICIWKVCPPSPWRRAGAARSQAG